MKKNMTKVMAMGMVLTMLAGTTVFAVDGTATNDMAKYVGCLFFSFSCFVHFFTIFRHVYEACGFFSLMYTCII